MTEAPPEWLQPLASAASTVRADEITRFSVVPDGVTARRSAVLIAVSQTVAGPSVLLLERAARMRNHAGQVAFPGGALDETDPDLTYTALREANEEVGLRPESVDVVAVLPDLFLPPSRFLVTPVIAWWRGLHEVGVVDANEVARVANVPIAELADPANRFRVSHPSGFRGPGFAVSDLFVWGFTAGLLDALLRLGGWAQPWDETVERPIP
ncbi:ADP-ribose pyrophosphatase YjhB (NUDIX family) [Jatrophihabitans sp. GAS493]|uniref:NUDIX hydrolase n=1 Tax=Jatrophihabitans sp. GAS493 TaxID=1907575 RepID=UPI000BC0344F|nr:CoA pyrophosphatase [Jatrophihabitans sp. GAS493]SOD71893.1 ADP-ribose pyrophosphatase YjhB (NUDIX family) [Jatrophihabitans sp. GAS493]